MAKYVALKRRVLLHSVDISTALNGLTLKLSREEKQTPTYGYDAIQRLAGIKSMELTGKGYHDTASGGIDATLFGNLGVNDRVLTVAATQSDGAIAYMTKGVSLSYSLFGKIKDVSPVDFAAYSQGVETVRATVLGVGAKTTTGNGTARQLGAVAAEQHLFGALHVTTVAGSGPPSLTVKIQSCAAENFASGVTDRITFTAVAAAGAQWATPVAGEITDTWWRAQWTISGGSPSFTISVAAGIQ